MASWFEIAGVGVSDIASTATAGSCSSGCISNALSTSVELSISDIISEGSKVTNVIIDWKNLTN